ncbi:hypothetical protein ACF0H5_012404 [Mactra antiquata]
MLKSVSSKPPTAPKTSSVRSPSISITKAQHVKTTNTQKCATTSLAKTPNPSLTRTPTSKQSSRHGPPPSPQLTVVRYVIDNDVLKCPACLDVFKSPRVIPCGHSLCLDCLNSIIVYTDTIIVKDTFQCPVCHKFAKPRDTNVIRQKWATQFPVNSVLQRLLRNASLKNPNDGGLHKAFCGVCLLNNMTRPVVSYCNTCLEHQCDVCSKYHSARDDAREHDVTMYVERDVENDKVESHSRPDLSRKSPKFVKDPRAIAGRRTKLDAKDSDGLVPAGSVVVAQTVTAADAFLSKAMVKLGQFNGNAPSDSATSDFRSITFLTNSKVVMADHANKKLKVFDISHKTRIELIADLAIRAVPSHMCRVNECTVAVITERSGVYHVRLFTIRDKISHFVHRIIDGVPLGIGSIQNTIFCSFLDDAGLIKYRLTRAQQQKVGSIKQDQSGNNIFHHPGAMCSGLWHGTPALLVADETEYGVTVTVIDASGQRKSSVFFECEFSKPKTEKQPTNGVLKTNRSGRGKSSRNLKKDEVSDTTNESELGTIKGSNRKQTTGKADSPSNDNPTERVSGRHTFRRVDEYGRVINDRKSGREIERPTMSDKLRGELSIDLNKLNVESGDTIGKTKRSARMDSKAVERAQKKPVGKVFPQQTKNGASGRASEQASNETESARNPGSTITSNSTVGTVTFAVPPKLVYRADCITMDNGGNFYLCMSGFNKIHQMSPDGRVKRDLLSEKDGLVAPKCISFSLKNDVLLVTCLKSNKVSMFKMK